MSYSYSGKIDLNGLPMGEDAIGNVVAELMIDEDGCFNEYKDYFNHLKINTTSIYVDGDGDFEEMDALKSIFIDVAYEVTKKYQECYMKARFRGTNSSTGDAYIMNLEMKDRHVRRIDMDGGEEDIYCPECDEWILSLGDLEFGYEYECDECGYKLSEDEIIDILEEMDVYSEYDI